MMNESMTITPNVGPIKVLDDDLKSLAGPPPAPKPKIHKFPTSFANDQETQAAKKRLQDYQGKQWTLISNKDGSLVYSDKANINLSKSKVVLDRLKA